MSFSAQRGLSFPITQLHDKLQVFSFFFFFLLQEGLGTVNVYSCYKVSKYSNNRKQLLVSH